MDVSEKKFYDNKWAPCYSTFWLRPLKNEKKSTKVKFIGLEQEELPPGNIYSYDYNGSYEINVY